MAVSGKTITLFLMDGVVTGRIKCSLPNWTGIAYKIPRTDLDMCKTRADLKQSGVYFLFGKSDQDGQDMVYVGQAGTRKNGEGILGRLQEHGRRFEKFYWTEAIAFTTSNNSFGPTEICYLENRFTALAKQADRYVVSNDNEPNPGNITEEKECELNDFIEYAKIVIGILGHKVFIAHDENPISTALTDEYTDSEHEFYLKTSKVEAKGKRTSEGFVVFKGSKIASIPTRSCPEFLRQLRHIHAAKIDSNNILTESILFSSPSSAAGFVNYASANGRECWKTQEGKTLKMIENGE